MADQKDFYSSKLPLGLVMTGGGARGAYQAGVLKRIGEIKSLRHGMGPFQIIGGASAGAINTAALACGNHTFYRCTKWLGELWGRLTPDQVYRTSVGSFTSQAGRWIKDLSFGGFLGGGNAQSLMDAAPLRTFLAEHIRPEWIQRNIDRKKLRSACIAATSYTSGKTFIFIQGEEGHPVWYKSRRIALSTPLTVDHVCASSAIPLIFGPVLLQTKIGLDYFGDGCLRLVAPLSPVIRLGAKRVFAIGIRSVTSDHVMQKTVESIQQPPLAQIMGVALNAIFLDHLDADLEHLDRLNKMIESGMIKSDPTSQEGIRPIRTLSMTPSVDLGEVAADYKDKMPGIVRYFMAGLGTKKASSVDLMSYLLFDSSYTGTLVSIGYNDASKRIDEIEDFIFNDKP